MGKIIKNPCGKCRGTGTQRENKKLTVNIPGGIDNGERIALRGMGSDGKNGGPAGDLIITVSVRKHSVFERNGFDIYCELPITVAEATLGAELQNILLYIEGNVSFKCGVGYTSFVVFYCLMPMCFDFIVLLFDF